MAQSQASRQASAEREVEDIPAAPCGGLFPLTPALSLGERVREGKRRECPTRVLDIPETGELGESSGGAGLFPN